jgi:VCBS repeat-containing protein
MDARKSVIRALLPVGLLAGSLFIAGPASAAVSLCDGLTPTIVGTSGDDVIVGTWGDDIISGLGGADTIDGRGGDDIICGGYGTDFIEGGHGDDRILGGGGIDMIYGQGGEDTIFGEAGKDWLFGGSAADTLDGGAHGDRLFGGGGDDILLGGDANDRLRGSSGNDTLYGGPGDDNLKGGTGTDIIVGDAGADTARGNAGYDRCESERPFTCEDDLNDAPRAADDHFTVDEDTTLVGNLLVDNGAGPDADPNADPIKVVAIDNAPVVGEAEFALESGATVTVNENGTFSYNAGSSVATLGEGAVAEDAFAYTVADSKGKADVGIVAVTIGGTNDAPVAAADIGETDEDTAIDIDVLGNDSDAEEQDLIVAAVDTSGIAGTVVVNPDNTVRYTPPAAFDAMDDDASTLETFTYIVTDGHGGSATAEVTVLIAGIDDSPTAGADTSAVDEDGSVVVDVLANDFDPEAAGSLSASLAAAPEHGVVMAAGPGLFEYTPNENWNGVDTFTYEVTDATGNTSVGTVTITVGAVNDAPIAADDIAHAIAGSMIIILVLPNDTDVDGDALSVTITSNPAHGTVVVLGTGALAYTADAGFSGVDELTYQVSDAGNDIDMATVSVTVSN